MGLLLVLYGTLNLWVAQTANAGKAARQTFCGWALCQPSGDDLPTALERGPEKPLAQARAALLLEPASAYRWADLAESEMNARQVESGKFCVRQALALAPGNPAILFRAADFYVRIENYPEAISNLLAVLRNPDLSAYSDRVFALYSQMDLPLKDLLNQGLPHSPAEANSFLRFWINQDKLEEAQETWNWISQNSLTSEQTAGSYAALLAKAGKWDDAMQSWIQNTAQLDSSYGKTNWVYNGSFEMAPVESPFDWHLEPVEAVQVTRDTEEAYKASNSLRLKFVDTPKGSEPLAFQTVILKPGKWQIKAAMKTHALLGNQGVVVRVVDAEDATRLDVMTDTFGHTQEWTTVGKGFVVGSATRLARVEIMRPAANDVVHLTGTVWLDAVSLMPVP